MKKLATVIATAASLAIAAPVFACPDMDHGTDETAPRTAEKDKKEAPKQDKAKDADKAKAKDADKAKTAKPADKDKKPDKVSAK